MRRSKKTSRSTSPDRTMRVFLTVTNQPSIGAIDCQKLMREVKAFQASAHEGWDGGPLQILVTGRSAYVAEISLSMRHDIVVTLLGSILLVSGVFYFGFHRWLPLIGMGLTLLLCCLVALAAGLLIFHQLNMVTIGFCAILIGLGVDFAILVFGRYQQARDEGIDHPASRERSDPGPWESHLLWRPNDGGRLHGLDAGGLPGIHSAWYSDRAWHYVRRHFHDDGFLPFPPTEQFGARDMTGCSRW